jgi:hypothetical protein
LNESDPTDHALAAIASILDKPESQRGFEAATADKPAEGGGAMEADGYRKFGPGPIASIRLQWTVRRDPSGEHYVDETVGQGSTPIVSGPMSADAAIRTVDDREREAQRQFAQLKAEMAGGPAASPSPVHPEDGSA